MSKKKQSTQTPIERQTPDMLWGAGKWRTIKFVSGLLSFVILMFMLATYRGLGDALGFRPHILPNFMIDLILLIVGIFFLRAPWSPLHLYGKPKHRWLFGWVFFMALISHFIASLIGLVMTLS